MTTITGLPTMVGIGHRTSWKVVVAWIVGLTALTALSTVSIADLYSTPEEIAGYATIADSGAASYMINGRVAGIDTIGGVLANEMNFVFAIAIPLMAITLVNRNTRRDEEDGRLELLLSARVGRQAPPVAAVGVAAFALTVACVAIGVCFVAVGAPAANGVLYAATWWAIGWVFLGVALVAAQVFGGSRAVLGASIGLMLVLFVARGVGAVDDTALVWLSPFGWGDRVAPFGDPSAGPLVLSLVVGSALIALGVQLNRGRDLDAALVPPRPAAPTASAFLRRPIGLVWHLHRNTLIGWTLGIGIGMALYGSLTESVLDAVADNPDLAAFFGDGQVAVDSVVASFLVFLAALTAAFGIAATGVMRREEQTGRLEAQLSQPRSRLRWAGTHLVAVLGGTVVVFAIGAVALATTASASIGDGGYTGDVLAASASFLPATLVLVAVPCALFGWIPRSQGVAWAVFAVAAVLAYMGPALDLPESLIDLSPLAMIGQPPAEAARPGVVAAVAAAAGALVAIGLVGVRRRDVYVQ